MTVLIRREAEEAALEFLGAMFGIPPDSIPDDAVEQLLDAFLPALQIMVERAGNQGYNGLWRQFGWRGVLYECRKNMGRLWAGYWLSDEGGSKDHAVDLLNYVGFFLRGRQENLPEWGEIGAPSRGETL